MSRLFPFRTSAESKADAPRLVDISEEAADDVFAALSSGTARAAYKALHDDPRTASDLADLTDTSLQNVRYHLDNLQDAGLVEVVDTWYSERGTEMKVYAPTDTSLVVFAGEDDDRDTVWSVVKNLVGGVGVLGLASVVVQRLATHDTLLPSPTPKTGGPGNATTTAAETTTTTATSTPTTAQTTAEATHTTVSGGGGTGTATQATQTVTHATETVVSYTQTTAQTYESTAATHATQTTPATTHATTEAAAATAQSLPPGLLFFLGGLVVLLSIAVWQYAR